MAFPGSSDWHEQVEFSEHYFKHTNYCRDAQRMGVTLSWKDSLLSKISFASGILTDDEKAKVKGWVEEINKRANSLIAKKNEEKRTGMTSAITPIIEGKLQETLFRVESEFDSIVNKKMPFLNIRKRKDIGEM